jgi:hypothetical protein
MVRRTINTTATTGHQAVRASMPIAKIRQERARNSATQNSDIGNSGVKSVSSLLCRRAVQAGSRVETDAALTYHSYANSTSNSAARFAASDNAAQLGVSAHLVSARHPVAVMQNAGLEAHQLSLTSGL